MLLLDDLRVSFPDRTYTFSSLNLRLVHMKPGHFIPVVRLLEERMRSGAPS